MKMFYREHRGGFEESLATMRELEDIGELDKLEDGVVFQPYGYDERLQSNTTMVTTKDNTPLGFVTFHEENPKHNLRLIK